MKHYIQKILKIFTKPEMMILPGQLAFFIILSIFPLLTIITYIASNTNIFSSSLFSLAGTILPTQVTDLFAPFVTESEFTGNIAFFMIVGFYLISNGPSALIVTSNELFGIKHASFLKRRIKAFFMVIILMTLLLFTSVVLAYGNIIIGHVISLFPDVSNQLYTIYILLKWPIAFICIFWMIKLLYSLAPDSPIPSKYMNKGSLFTTIGWILVTIVYSFYASNYADYSRFYGSISSIIVLMLWIYFLSYIFVMGISINALEYENKK